MLTPSPSNSPSRTTSPMLMPIRNSALPRSVTEEFLSLIFLKNAHSNAETALLNSVGSPAVLNILLYALILSYQVYSDILLSS